MKNRRKFLLLAPALAASAEGLTLEQMCEFTGEQRRTAERMRDTIREVFPQMEEIADHPKKHFHIPKGLDGFYEDPMIEKLANLGNVIARLREARATGRAESLGELERKIKAAMRHERRLKTEVDVEALKRYSLLCQRLMQEQLYSAASIIASPRTAAANGAYQALDSMPCLLAFVTELAGHVAAEAARS